MLGHRGGFIYVSHKAYSFVTVFTSGLSMVERGLKGGHSQVPGGLTHSGY